MSGLEETPKIKINVVHRLVHAPHLLDVPRLDAFPQVSPVLGLAPGADLPILVVAGQTVVSTSLDVHGYKVQSSPARR